MNPVKIKRSQQGITRKELSQHIGVSYSTLSNIETGIPLTISVKVAKKLATFFHIEPFHLISQYEDYRQTLQTH